MTDALGHRLVFGVLLPSQNTVVQPEIEALRPAGVTNQVGRFAVSPKGEPIGLPAALELVMTTGPDALILGISMDAVADGIAKSRALAEDLATRSGLTVTDGTEAERAALRALGARRIAIVTPFQPAGDANVRAAFEDSGFEVVSIHGLCCADFQAIARVGAEDVKAAFRTADSDDAEAIVQVGTALAAARLIPDIEAELGKLVVGVNAATYWQALRTNGIDDRLDGHGRLFSDH